MTLDEAIKHCEEKAKELESTCALWKSLADEKGLSMPSDYEPCKKCAEEHRQLAEWLKELKQLRNQTSWIPVSKRLPKKNMACLVAVGKFNLTQIAMYSDLMGTINHKIFYQGDYGHENFEDITQYVNAWIPLPKSYKDAEE